MNNSLTDYLLHLADTTLILSHRNSEWCGHGPILEQDIALTNISLDLLGQSRLFYQYAAEQINNSKQSEGLKAPSPLERAGGEVDEDKLAYLRTERAYKNLLLVEQPNGDWGQTILRQYLYSQFQQLLFQQLQYHNDEHVAAIATKSLKETNYHVRWSSEWVIRLGDGTDESKQRMLHAVHELWRYTGELFLPADYETVANVDFNSIQQQWHEKVSAVFEEAALSFPEKTFMQTGGKTGIHTEHLGYILSDLQYMQRAYPNSEW
ncbi:phenylacetate-CoA oxygenase subunit PaaC [Lacibacter sp. MH-610]|uniref:1,2-phenylacetyl-CoA epoxidase subunit PaaC n=1 Tax=Lacibacter sp. MH-610 TaxID=3020883 RepID=UPI003892B782